MNTVVANKILGLTLGEKSLAIAEVTLQGTEYKVLRSAALAYPEGVNPAKPQELGKAIKDCLRKAGISTRQAAIGLPARWIITRRKDLPPANEQTAAGMLRLAAEGEFASEAKDLCVDYAGQAKTSAPAQVLMVATSGERIAQCQALAQAAGLRLRAIMPTGAAWREMAGPGTHGNELVLNLAATGSELVSLRDGAPTLIRHLMLSNGQCTDAGAVTGELRRAIAGFASDEQARPMVIWGDSGGDIVREVESKLGVRTRAGEIRGPVASGGPSSAAATAVALCALRRSPGRVDFLHSRLAPASAARPRRQMAWAGAIIGVLLLSAIACWWDLRSQEDRLTQIQTHLKDNAAELKKAELAVARLNTAKGWTAGKPLYLACLGEITGLFPDEGSIWATSLSLRADMTGQLIGKTASESHVLNLLDRMKDAKRFKDLKLLDMRDAGKNSRETVFSISFTYRPE